MKNRKDVKLYNVLFPFWMILLLIPQLWLIILPGNFIIDSIVFSVSLKILKLSEVKRLYRLYIGKIFFFGIISDLIGSAYMMLMALVFHLGTMGDELYITLPALIISSVMIFVFNYYITFKGFEKPIRKKLALTFAVVTAPYTFLVPSSWLYF